MASASSTSAKSLFAESRSRLSDRVLININNVASLARQIQRGSKTTEIMMHCARSFAAQEQLITNSGNNLKNIEKTVSKLAEQEETVRRTCYLLEEVKEQTRAMQRWAVMSYILECSNNRPYLRRI